MESPTPSLSWVIRFTPLFTSAKIKILDLPEGSVVEGTGRSDGNLSEVSFITRQKTYMGWVYTIYLEELVYQFKQSTVFTQQTEYPYDAAQYIVWEGNTLYNLCGESCVAYIFGDTLESFWFAVKRNSLLGKWKSKPVSLYNKIIYGGKSATTGIYDLMDMADIYNGKSHPLLPSLYDPISRSTLVSPNRISKLLEDFNIISGCRISGTTGELKASGIPHWIVLENVVQDGIKRGWAEIWNPFSGRRELYSWREFFASIYPIYGLIIERNP